MPTKYSNKKYRPRRRVRKRYRRKTTTVQRGLNFSKSQIVKMRYSDIVAINPVSGLASSYLYRANSIFDPDYTGVGHQPLSHDEWALFYQHYVVIGAKINIRPQVRGNTTSDNVVCGVFLRDGTTPAITSAGNIIEQGKGRYAVLSNSSGGASNVRGGLNAYFSMKKYFNIKDIQDANSGSQFKAGFGNSPNEGALFEIWAEGMNPATDPSSVDFVVTIDYTVMLTEPKVLLQS